jgi:hypothetical protein
VPVARAVNAAAPSWQATGCKLNNRGREIALAVPTMGAGDAALQADAMLAKICCGSCFSSQPSQRGAQPQFPRKLQGETLCRSRRMAWSRCGIMGRLTVLAETGSHLFDSTRSPRAPHGQRLPHAACRRISRCYLAPSPETDKHFKPSPISSCGRPDCSRFCPS